MWRCSVHSEPRLFIEIPAIIFALDFFFLILLYFLFWWSHAPAYQTWVFVTQGHETGEFIHALLLDLPLNLLHIRADVLLSPDLSIFIWNLIGWDGRPTWNLIGWVSAPDAALMLNNPLYMEGCSEQVLQRDQ